MQLDEISKKEQVFKKLVWEHYHAHGRHSLAWRKTKNPYRILVSEIMLQQTQVDRVVLKYKTFLTRFPSIESLAKAPLSEVLRFWQGLGYNRRAKMLHRCAKDIGALHGGHVPKRYAELTALPGIGPYTASAVCVFAYDMPVVMIETNIRSVFLHHFFPNRTDVTDKEILAYVERTLPQENVREWYYALMDYGVHIKKIHGNPNNRSKHYMRQSSFEGSDRQIRGAVVRTLLQSEKPLTFRTLQKKLQYDQTRMKRVLDTLHSESLVEYIDRSYRISQ